MSRKGDPIQQQLPFDAPLLAFDEPCPYLPNTAATFQGFLAGGVPPALYRSLMDVGFRRSGRLFYHPVCDRCSQCQPIRLPVQQFHPSRSQRRCASKNADLRMSVAAPMGTLEKIDLYRRYVMAKHSDSGEKDMGAIHEFLYNRVVDSLEFCYRDEAGRLLAVGICDIFDDALSSVYTFYEPTEMHRGLGTYSALREIEYAKQQALEYYYLGFYVRDCGAMNYKASFRPCQLLDGAGGWKPFGPGDD